MSTDQRLAATALGQVSYLEAGRGPAFVMVHGIGSGARSWRAQLAALSGAFRIIAWDAPGYGDSTSPTKSWPDAGDYAGVLAAFLDALEIRRCHLLGHSLGTLIVARFAADHPDRVMTLTLSSIASGHAQLPTEERTRLLESRLADVVTLGARGMAEKRGPRLLGKDATRDMIRAVVDTMAQVRPDGYAQAARMLSSANILDDIKRLPATLPLQIVYGTDDVITPPAANLRVAQACAHAVVHSISGAGHALYLEKPDQFSAILRKFTETKNARA